MSKGGSGDLCVARSPARSLRRAHHRVVNVRLMINLIFFKLHAHGTAQTEAAGAACMHVGPTVYRGHPRLAQGRAEALVRVHEPSQGLIG